MERTSTVYKTYVEILKRELVCAMGCTEPIAIAYCAAVARKALGTLPSEIDVAASGNIIKNVKSVIVPNTGGLRGIEAAAAIGALAGDAEAGLQVVSHVTPDEIAALPGYHGADGVFCLGGRIGVPAGYRGNCPRRRPFCDRARRAGAYEYRSGGDRCGRFVLQGSGRGYGQG